ncbi:hypothetical protein JCM15831A_18270 [Asaia astilbis]
MQGLMRLRDVRKSYLHHDLGSAIRLLRGNGMRHQECVHVLCLVSLSVTQSNYVGRSTQLSNLESWRRFLCFILEDTRERVGNVMNGGLNFLQSNPLLQCSTMMTAATFTEHSGINVVTAP